MIWLPAFLLSCLAAESFAHMPIARVTAASWQSCAQARRIILSPAISDHWKEKVMAAYALRLGRQSLVLAACFTAFVAAAALAMTVLGQVMPEAAAFMDSVRGLAFGLLVTLLYYPVRRRLVRA